MALLSQTDRLGQIELLTTHIRKNFGKRPQGCWIPSAAWEQSLVSILYTCGMKYTFLDEDRISAAGISFDDLYAPWISENQGKIVTVFPLFKNLQQELAQREPAAVLEDLLHGSPLDGKRLVTLFPDQIYGLPEEAAELRWGRLFEALSGIAGQAALTLPGKVYKTLGHIRKAYFPGDRDRNFLIAYPEANGIYAKMIFAHNLISQLRGDKARKQSAREELWKAQGYSVFSGGTSSSSGICDNLLRKAAYKALLGSEKICRGNKFVPSLTAFDFDLDGRVEYLFQDRNINCYVKTEGAAVFELDYLPKTWNYLDTFTPGGAGCRGAAFLDRLVPADLELSGEASGTPGSLTAMNVEAGDFSGSRSCMAEEYEPVSVERARLEGSFRLKPREGAPFGQIEIEKQFRLSKDTLTVAYTLTNRGDAAAAFMLLPRIELSFAGDTTSALQRIIVVRDGLREELGAEFRDCAAADEIDMRDRKNEVTLHLTSDSPFAFWIFPVRTPCGKGGVVQEQYQSTCIIPRKPVSLGPGESYKTKFSLRIHQ
jgi:hypothetical protein